MVTVVTEIWFFVTNVCLNYVFKLRINWTDSLNSYRTKNENKYVKMLRTKLKIIHSENWKNWGAR